MSTILAFEVDVTLPDFPDAGDEVTMSKAVLSGCEQDGTLLDCSRLAEGVVVEDLKSAVLLLEVNVTLLDFSDVGDEVRVSNLVAVLSGCEQEGTLLDSLRLIEMVEIKDFVSAILVPEVNTALTDFCDVDDEVAVTANVVLEGDASLLDCSCVGDVVTVTAPVGAPSEGKQNSTLLDSTKLSSGAIADDLVISMLQDDRSPVDFRSVGELTGLISVLSG